MILKKKDFIEIEFTGTVKNGEMFDSNVKEDLKKLHFADSGHTHEVETKPLAFCLGEGMFLEGLEDFLMGKNLGKYEVELSPEKAFGTRNPKLIQIMPSKAFREQKLNPVAGMTFNFDGRIAKVISSSGGRVIVDFNNPLAGKTVVYRVNVLRKIDDLNEKAKSLIEFLFKRDMKFEINNKKITVEAEKGLSKFVELFKDKFKGILDLDLEVREIGKAKSKPDAEKKKESDKP